MRLLILMVALAMGAMLLSPVRGALADQPAPPNYGQKNNPAGTSCPDFIPGVEKCFPVSWFGADPQIDHVVIVTDQLGATAAGGSASGWVNFWCRSTVGFKYMIGASGLAPWSEYRVTARPKAGGPGYDLGVIRTDADGSGSIRGVLQLGAGGYNFIVEVLDGSGAVLLTSAADSQGFVVVQRT